MKKFEDLDFLFCHSFHPFKLRKRAEMYFKNGYGVSVLLGDNYNSNGIDTFDVAILYKGEITYNTCITDDVIVHATKKDISLVMKKVQELCGTKLSQI